MPAPTNAPGSMMLAEEYFAAENDLFLPSLRGVAQLKTLAGFADRWKKDPRPWARRQIFDYLAQPLDCAGHQPIVKRLFKNAEEAKDHELMAAFVVAFDRHVRRQARIRRRWDMRSRALLEEERLVTPRDVMPLKADRQGLNPATGRQMTYGVRTPRAAKLFTYRTRYYLRRRAWRYFRRLGFHDPKAYCEAIVMALIAYEDADLQRGEHLLDSWGLMHACFGEHAAVEFGASQITLRDGLSPGELTPAPCFAAAWQDAAAAPALLRLTVHARARLVRLWAMQVFEREHAGHAVQLATIIALLEHEAAEVQQFGAKLLESSAVLGTLPVASWLQLLQTKNDEALQRICDAFGRHVASDRLDLGQCIELACVRAVPVARLGQKYLRERTITATADRERLGALADTTCPAVAGELATWALGIIGTKENYSCDEVIRFFDGGLRETRVAAWTWLEADSVALRDAVLWSRLAETPFDDVRLRVVDFLQKHTAVPGASADQLETIWRSVLLGVHRGGRQKAKAVQQIAEAIVENPARSETLLPVLAVAVRSVRGPEARAGLAAVVRVVERLPQLGEAVRRFLPEMKLEVAA